jgi:tetratricopeptide (TPR) repeat protein
VTKQEIVPEPEVRAALARMTASEMFRDSPQLAAFLRFVTEAELRGESERIKGYTIGVEALGRSEHFDPQTDPIVRVEATRLRRTMERYYAGPGASDPVVIALSPGSYVPSFRYRTKDLSHVVAEAVAAGGRRNVRLGGLAGLAVLVVVTAIFFYPRASDRVLSGQLQPGNGMPVILLHPLAVSGTPKPDVVPSTTLVEKLRAALTRFDTINVVLPNELADAEKRGVKRPVRLRLTGNVDYRDDGAVNLRFQLFDAADNALVWSRVFERFAEKGSQAAAEDAIVTEIVTILAQPFGVIRAHERNRYVATGLGDPRYNCIVESSESLRSFDPIQHRKAKDCLDRLTRIDPSFASGFAYLAALYLREYQFDIGVGAGQRASLDRALVLARQAVEKQPESSRAYQILSAVLYGRQDYSGSLAAAERAVALNRYDMTVLSDYGGRLVMSGEIDKGLELLEQAAAYGTLRPSWYNFYLFLGHYLKGNRDAASHYASQITPERYPLGHVAHALAAHAAGNKEQTREALLKLVALRVSWRSDLAGELRKLIGSEMIVQQLANDLAAAGLDATLR